MDEERLDISIRAVYQSLDAVGCAGALVVA